MKKDFPMSKKLYLSLLLLFACTPNIILAEADEIESYDDYLDENDDFDDEDFNDEEEDEDDEEEDDEDEE
jgi:hypothetical protein